MRARQGPLLFAAVLMLAAALFAQPGTIRAAGCESTFADSRHFRKVLGLSTDADLIRSLADDPNADCTWGVPLTFAEAAEIELRQGYFARIDGLVSFVEAHSDTFDVLYLDNLAGGIVVVNVTARASAAELAAARGLVPPDVPVRFDTVRYSRDEIDAAQEVVVRNLGEDGFEGVAGFGSSGRHNAIEFDVRCDRADELAALLEQHLPADILRYIPFGDCDLPDSSTSDFRADTSSWLLPASVGFLSLALLVLRLGTRRTRRSVG